jgi:hypothetical protein
MRCTAGGRFAAGNGPGGPRLWARAGALRDPHRQFWSLDSGHLCSPKPRLEEVGAPRHCPCPTVLQARPPAEPEPWARARSRREGGAASSVPTASLPSLLSIGSVPWAPASAGMTERDLAFTRLPRNRVHNSDNTAYNIHDKSFKHYKFKTI